MNAAKTTTQPYPPSGAMGNTVDVDEEVVVVSVIVCLCIIQDAIALLTG